MKITIASAVAIAVAGITAAVAPGVSAAQAAVPQARYIRMAGTARCVTALHERPGAAVTAQPCRHRPDQRWVIGHGVVRLAGTRLRLDISRRTWAAVLTLPGSWRDDWRLDRHHHLAGLVLSRRFGAREVLTLPSALLRRLIGKRVSGSVLIYFPVSRHPHIDAGFQGIRLSRAAR